MTGGITAVGSAVTGFRVGDRRHRGQRRVRPYRAEDRPPPRRRGGPGRRTRRTRHAPSGSTTWWCPRTRGRWPGRRAASTSSSTPSAPGEPYMTALAMDGTLCLIDMAAVRQP
ncbi:hypothetical protein [Streptomyces microflavus]|uniref:hypothetical protein n=1 Tax=Streptomyces microflavus TaxID=1919 RepID=UPI0036E491C1